MKGLLTIALLFSFVSMSFAAINPRFRLMVSEANKAGGYSGTGMSSGDFACSFSTSAPRENGDFIAEGYIQSLQPGLKAIRGSFRKTSDPLKFILQDKNTNGEIEVMLNLTVINTLYGDMFYPKSLVFYKRNFATKEIVRVSGCRINGYEY